MIFKVGFTICDVSNCLFYKKNDWFVLTDRSVELPAGRSSCLILVRELTSLLFSLLPHALDNFAGQRDLLYTCGGCTGLIKFHISELVPGHQDRFNDPGDAAMEGSLEAIPPAELLQIFHMHQKTGRLFLEVTDGTARVTFREGAIVAARYGELDNQEAVHVILRLRKGRFCFLPGLPAGALKSREIGDFMMILMEGLRRIDEGGEGS